MKIHTKRCAPQVLAPHKFYGLPKIHKVGVPLRPIVSSRGALSYETAKKVARIIKPLVGKSPYNVQNTRDFVQQMKNIPLLQNECIISYDVKALFTSVPIEPAIEINSQPHHLSVGVLFKEYLLQFSRQIL